MATRDNGQYGQMQRGEYKGRSDDVVGGSWTQQGEQPQTGRRTFYQTAIERRAGATNPRELGYGQGQGSGQQNFGQGQGQGYGQQNYGQGQSDGQGQSYGQQNYGQNFGGGQYGDYRGEHRYGGEERSPQQYGTSQYGTSQYGQQQYGQQQRDFSDQQRRRRWTKEPFTARDIMTTNPRCLRPEQNLCDAAQIMQEENVGIVPVVDDKMHLQGVITDRDIVVRTAKDDRRPSECRVGDVMTREVHCVTGEESLPEIIELMGEKQIRRVPIVDRDDRLVGIISMADIANRADYDEELQEALEKISSKRSFWSRIFG